MKRFKYSLENVLHYKEQILDSIKAEHGTLLVKCYTNVVTVVANKI